MVSWGDGARPLAVHSIRKSLISALYGQLHDSGSLRLDTTIGELGIDDTPAPLQMTDWDVFEHARYHYRTDVLGGNLRYPCCPLSTP